MEPHKGTPKRHANFTAEETDLTLNLVKKYINIIEIKEINAHHTRRKKNIWKEIEKQFNNNKTILSSVYRDDKQLRGRYDNLKKRVRQKIACNKKAQREGGPQVSLTPPEQKLQDILLSYNIENGRESESNETNPTAFSFEVCDVLEDSEIIIEEKIDGSESDDSQLSLQISEPIVESNNRTSYTKHNQPSEPKQVSLLNRLTEERIEIAKLQKQLLKEQILQKVVQRKILEEELEHKKEIHRLERQQLISKIDKI